MSAIDEFQCDAAGCQRDAGELMVWSDAKKRQHLGDLDAMYSTLPEVEP